MKRSWLLWSLLLLLLVIGFGQSNLFSQSLPQNPDASHIIQFLNQTIGWYRELAVQQKIATEPTDLMIVYDNRQTADQVVRLAFDFARTEAELTTKQSSSNRGQENDGAGACRLADCTTTRTASIRHHGVFQYLFAVASSESQYARVRVRTNAKYLEGTMTRQFDEVAIGTESAASAVASRCREAGVQVAIVDSRLRGCDPKKALVEAAEAVD